MTLDDLLEIRGVRWLQTALFDIGTFMFGGAFWKLVDLLSSQNKFEFTAWMTVCVLSMIFGVVLHGVGLCLFRIKLRRLDKYFFQIRKSDGLLRRVEIAS